MTKIIYAETKGAHNRSMESQILKAVKDEIGISLASLGEPSSTLSNAIIRGNTPRVFGSLVSKLRNRADLLREARIENVRDVERVLERTGISKTSVARALGMSQQALSFSLAAGPSEERLAAIRYELRRRGAHLERIIQARTRTIQ